MTYDSKEDLPEGVRNNLPTNAQAIYISVFNNAYEEYDKNPEKIRDEGSPEEVAHRVAWSAVKQKYEKINNNWYRKE